MKKKDPDGYHNEPYRNIPKITLVKPKKPKPEKLADDSKVGGLGFEVKRKSNKFWKLLEKYAKGIGFKTKNCLFIKKIRSRTRKMT